MGKYLNMCSLFVAGVKRNYAVLVCISKLGEEVFLPLYFSLLSPLFFFSTLITFYWYFPLFTEIGILSLLGTFSTAKRVFIH